MHGCRAVHVSAKHYLGWPHTPAYDRRVGWGLAPANRSRHDVVCGEERTQRMTQACVSCGRALSEPGRFRPNCGVLQSLKRDVADRMDALLGG